MDMGSQDSNQVVGELVLKRLLPSGGQRDIVCNPGEVTILPSISDMDELRDALFECSSLESVYMRLGASPLSSEDVFRVSEPFSFEHSTPLEELSSYGVEPEIAFSLLSQIGSDVESAQAIENLSTLQKWRLKVLCGLKSSSLVIHCDFVGFNLPDQVLELVCEEIRKGSLDESKVVVVTGLGDVPKCWRNASNVRIQGSGKAGELLLGSKNTPSKKKTETSGEASTGVGVEAPARMLNKTQVSAEVIPNLTIDSKQSRAESQIQVIKRRRSSGNLTSVNSVRFWVRRFFGFKALFAGLFRR